MAESVSALFITLTSFDKRGDNTLSLPPLDGGCFCAISLLSAKPTDRPTRSHYVRWAIAAAADMKERKQGRGTKGADREGGGGEGEQGWKAAQLLSVAAATEARPEGTRQTQRTSHVEDSVFFLRLLFYKLSCD